MAEVYLVKYGCVDFPEEIPMAAPFDEFDDAKEYAEECARDQFDENIRLTEEGYFMDTMVRDDGSTMVAILEPHTRREFEWWRVETYRNEH